MTPQPMIPQRNPLPNPILDEIDRAHASLSPPAQQAIGLSGIAPPATAGSPGPMLGSAPRFAGLGQTADAPPPSQPSPNAMQARGLAAPPAAAPLVGAPPSTGEGAIRPLATPSTMRGLGPAPNPALDQSKGEFNRLTAPPLQGPLAHTKADTGRSGLEQIKNPYGRHSLEVLDAIGTGFFPRLAMGIPGTQLHHNLVVNRAASNVEEGEKQQTEEAQQQHLGAEANNLNAEAEERLHPKPKDAFDLFMQQNPNGTAEDWASFQEAHRPISSEFEAWLKEPQNKGKTVADFMKLKQETATPKEPKEGELPLGDRVTQLNSLLGRRYQVLHPKQNLPADYTIPANATQKDYDRIDKALESEERASGTEAQRRESDAMRQEAMSIAASNRQNKQDVSTRQAAYKAYTPALDSGERFNVMAKNYEDAVKNHDQQAMLSLLANHLGMTMGLQKGARMTKDIIHEAQQSRPWLQGLQAKFDKDGYLQGVNLTPEQMRQMVSLGRERFSEDLTKGRNEARYMGANDDGPERTPNDSTMRFYLAQTNGDIKKAKDMAAKDGWSVK